MKTFYLFCSCIFCLPLFGQTNTDPVTTIEQTISAINDIHTIVYRQQMTRSNPRNTSEIIEDTREMYLSRLPQDSIVGAKGHWYFLTSDETGLRYEDIYDGSRLIRKNNSTKAARIYDLDRYPEFRQQPFWSHQTPYTLQYMLQFVLDNRSAYTLTQLSDTLINNIACHQVHIRLEDRESMPGFMSELQDAPGNVSILTLFIDNNTNYPIQVNMDNFSKDQPQQRFFTHQRYFDLQFNVSIEDKVFDTSDQSTAGYQLQEMKPRQ